MTTNRTSRSYGKIVALVLASSFLSAVGFVLYVPTPRTTHNSRCTSFGERRHPYRLRAKGARPLSLVRASDITGSDVLVDTDESLRPSWEADLTRDDLMALLDTAQAAARAAGQVIVSHLGCCSQSSASSQEECEIKYSIKDIVTQYDQQAQHVVKDIVLSEFPTHRFLGEEDVGAGGAASQAALEIALRDDSSISSNDANSASRSPFLWICDPIDVRALQMRCADLT
jgi:Inositol monophosphatase family